MQGVVAVLLTQTPQGHTGKWMSKGSCRPSVRHASMTALLPRTCAQVHAPYIECLFLQVLLVAT